MEYSNSMGVIVCIPTGGSSGIVPGVLYGAGQAMGLDDEKMVEGLLAAGMIGAIMARETNFSGAWGCQAEVTSGCALATGGLIHLLGGTPQQCCDGASMSLQSLLGLVCDPIARQGTGALHGPKCGGGGYGHGQCQRGAGRL